MSLDDFIHNPEIGKIKIDFPSICNANCIGCYSHAFNKNPKKKLPIRTVLKALDDSKELGIKQLVIAADGEPFMDLDYFFRTIKYSEEIGMESIVYSNGSLITPEIARSLYNKNISLLVKRNSMDHQRQDEILRTGLSQRMLQGVNNLIKAGFDYERLALQSFVSRYNEHDLDDVLRFCRSNGLQPYFEEFICLNQTKEVIDKMVMTPRSLLNAFKRYQKIDIEEFGIFTPVSPSSRRYGVRGCSLKRLISIDTGGYVKRCILDTVYGNITHEKLEDIQKRIPERCEGCSATVMKPQYPSPTTNNHYKPNFSNN